MTGERLAYGSGILPPRRAGNKTGSKEYSDVSIVGIVPEGVGVDEVSDVVTAWHGAAWRDVMMDRPGGSPLIPVASV